MIKRLQGIIIGAVAAVLLFGGIAAAASRTETIDVIFRNIRIVIDGEEFIPKDVSGKIVEPFIYNGTTYLPVRAVSQALGMDVDWDNDASTVYIISEAQDNIDVPMSPEVRSVVITYEGMPMTDVTLQMGERVPFRVRIEPVGAAGEIVWTSSNRSVFEAVPTDPSGIEATIAGIGRGSATLTVTVGGVEAECIIRVR